MCVHMHTHLCIYLEKITCILHIAFNKPPFIPPFIAKRRMHLDMEKEMPFPPLFCFCYYHNSWLLYFQEKEVTQLCFGSGNSFSLFAVNEVISSQCVQGSIAISESCLYHSGYLGLSLRQNCEEGKSVGALSPFLPGSLQPHFLESDTYSALPGTFPKDHISIMKP